MKLLGKVRNIYKSNKWVVLLSFLMLFLVVVSIGSGYFLNVSSDNYFMVAHDKLIREQGFVTTEMLRMHEGFDFVVPQWLFAMLFSLLERTIGYKITGILLFGILFASLYYMVSYFSKKGSAGYVYGIMMASFLFLVTNGIRPYYITVALLMIECVLLEKYFNRGNWKYLIGLPIISILLINIHNTMWIALFLVIACYIAELVINSIISKKLDKRLYTVAGCTLVSALAGLINPYGLKYITYMFRSLGSVGSLRVIIGELQGLFYNNDFVWWLYIVVLFVIVIYVVVNIRKVPIRMLFLFFGFFVASVMYKRNLVLFLTVGQVAVLYLLDGKGVPAIGDGVSKKLLIGFSVAFMVAFFVSSVEFPSKVPLATPFYEAVDNIIKYTDEDVSDITVFAQSLDVGSYATMQGYKPYIDNCAEVYGIENNGKFDVAEEFIKNSRDSEGIKKLVNKYHFDFIVFSYDIRDVLEPLGYELVEYSRLSEEDANKYMYEGTFLYKNINNEKPIQ